jgi:hypothetical protein
MGGLRNFQRRSRIRWTGTPLSLNPLRIQRNPSLSNVFKMDRQSGLGRTVRAGGRRAHPAPFYTPVVRFPLCQNKNGAGRSRSGRRLAAAGQPASLFSTKASGPQPVGCYAVRRPPVRVNIARHLNFPPPEGVHRIAQKRQPIIKASLRDGMFSVPN